jgi:hypothetical protein
MKTSGITAALPAQDLGRAKAFYVEKVGLQPVESKYLEANDGRVGLTIGDGVNQLFVCPAGLRGEGRSQTAPHRRHEALPSSARVDRIPMPT